MAVVKVKVGDENPDLRRARAAAPSMRSTLRCGKDLGKYQRHINGLELTDYRVAYP